MIARHLTEKDLTALKVIHETFYEQEFTFPDFTNHVLSNICITDDNNKIITAGTVKTIVEVEALTDKSWPLVTKGRALKLLLEGSMCVAQQNGYKSLHAYIQDENWLKVLFHAGFKPTRGQSIIGSW